MPATQTTNVNPAKNSHIGKSWFTNLLEAINDFRQGKFILVSDSPERENEADLMLSAQFANPQAINFMITHCKGLVCLAIDASIQEKCELPLMVDTATDPHQTAFTISVDGAPEYGVGTGISAYDRARTIEIILMEQARGNSLVSPGHMFPLVAKKGGLAERAGHTEAGVDLAKHLRHKPAAVIVEIINEQGQMAQKYELVAFANKHNLKHIYISDLQKYFSYLKTKQTIYTN